MVCNSANTQYLYVNTLLILNIGQRVFLKNAHKEEEQRYETYSNNITLLLVLSYMEIR